MSQEPERIRDLIILGRAAPEPIRDGRHTVCLGGYSREHGYVRLYPTQLWMDNCKRWNVISVPVETPSQDNRKESYKIAGSKEDWGDLHKKIRQIDSLSKVQQIQLVDELAGDCPIRLNENRVSLGVVKPDEIMDVYIDEDADTTVQMNLEMNERKGKSDYSQNLYLKYRCEDCSAKTFHEQHAIEWGVYRYWDNNDDVEGVIDALGFNDDNMNHYFFVGNLNNEREAYIVISILRFTDEDMIEAGVTPQNQDTLSRWG